MKRGSIWMALAAQRCDLQNKAESRAALQVGPPPALSVTAVLDIRLSPAPRAAPQLAS